jgi:phage tail tube protein FII
MLFSGIFLVEIFGIKKDIAVIIKSVVLYHDGNLYESVELPKHTTKFDNFKVLNYRNKMVTIW